MEKQRLVLLWLSLSFLLLRNTNASTDTNTIPSRDGKSMEMQTQLDLGRKYGNQPPCAKISVTTKATVRGKDDNRSFDQKRIHSEMMMVMYAEDYSGVTTHQYPHKPKHPKEPPT